MKTLEEIEHLKQSEFGRPRPRHGLKLLYWFSNDCLSLDQNDVLQLSCDPKNGDFGFHLFENRYERNSGKLLPNVVFPYYEVGNLSYVSSFKLPWYVRGDCTYSQDNSNMDRIIISLDNKWLHTVYVTQHSGLSRFNKHATYRISKNLILIIRDLTLEEFLFRTGFSKQKTYTGPVELSNRQFPCPAQTTTSICSPVLDICKSPTIVMSNNTQREMEANTDLGTGYSTEEYYYQYSTEANTDPITGYSRLPADSDQSSEEEGVDSSGNHNEYENCCRCIIL